MSTEKTNYIEPFPAIARPKCNCYISRVPLHIESLTDRRLVNTQKLTLSSEWYFRILSISDAHDSIVTCQKLLLTEDPVC